MPAKSGITPSLPTHTAGGLVLSIGSVNNFRSESGTRREPDAAWAIPWTQSATPAMIAEAPDVCAKSFRYRVVAPAMFDEHVLIFSPHAKQSIRLPRLDVVTGLWARPIE